jgi:hypothetical protein
MPKAEPVFPGYSQAATAQKGNKMETLRILPHRNLLSITILVLAVLALFASGCSSRVVPRVEKVSEELEKKAKTLTAPTDKSLVYIIRPAKFQGGGAGINISLGDNVVRLLGNGNYIVEEIKPGKHSVVIKMAYGFEQVLIYRSEAGKTVEFVVNDQAHRFSYDIPEYLKNLGMMDSPKSLSLQGIITREKYQKEPYFNSFPSGNSSINLSLGKTHLWDAHR